ncbi:hypothetical protein [Enterobacter roggenkampii]|uniref:hypothetical protein n=1 Tax=Enterobacter roggenkampii TaxID=1812935 RepID=UPI002017DE39|nr:hypothetical protein [Enterobacter roggenkampii]
MLKRLVAGQMSLPMTFWGWGICGNFLLGLIGLAGVQTGHPAMVPLSYILKAILFSAVLSGITFILRRKITVLGGIAFFIILIQVIMSVVMTIGLFSLFLSLYINLCNCLILICSIQHQKQVNLWTKNSCRLWLTNWPKISKPLTISTSSIAC